MFPNIPLIILVINFFITNGDSDHPGILSSKRKVLNRINGGNFFFIQAHVINERACSCMSEVSCSCCETAFMLFHMINRKICANFMYQRNGLNVDLTIDGNILSSMTVTNYMAFKMCSLIPGSLSSKVCLNILELNSFPRSITACPRLDFMTKAKRWILNYSCISISTALPDGNMTTMNSAMMVQSTTNRPPSSMKPESGQQMQTPPASNQMKSTLSVNSPRPVTSRPQSTAKPSKPASGSTVTAKPTPSAKPAASQTTASMNTTKPPGPPTPASLTYIKSLIY